MLGGLWGRRTRVVAWVGALLIAGCYGGFDAKSGETAGGSGADTEGSGTVGGSDTADTGETGGVEGLCGDPKPGSSPIRRLSAFEYSNTIEDLLGDFSRPGDTFAEEGGSGFDNNADVSTVSRLIAQKYMEAAEELAVTAVADTPGLLGCDPAPDEAGCVRSWIDGFGRRTWRRPLTTEEVDAMVSLYDDSRATFDVSESVGVVLQAFLQSPFFLYRVELGVEEAGPDAVHLDDWEMAARLSYLMWGSMPDAELLTAAEAGELSTKEQIEAQARRLLDDPKARRMALHFHEQWLDFHHIESTTKDPAVFPEFDTTIADLQRREIEAFVDHVLFDGDGTLGTMLSAPYTFVNEDLAAYYGIAGVSGQDFVMASGDGFLHSGLLTQGAVLTVQAKTNSTSPVARGLFVREQLLCSIPPPPPDNVDLMPPAPDPNATTREQYDQHRSDPACSACHELMDPIGFGLENFDGIGRWRDTQNGLEIDASGTLSAVPGIEPDFDGPIELGQRLSEAEMTRACVARQWFRFAYGRTESDDLDDCTLEELDRRFTESGGDIRELMVSLTQTDAFLFRNPGGGG